MLCEMHSVSSRIWTRVAVSIFYDDNHYTTGTSSRADHYKFLMVAQIWCVYMLESIGERSSLFFCGSYHALLVNLDFLCDGKLVAIQLLFYKVLIPGTLESLHPQIHTRWTDFFTYFQMRLVLATEELVELEQQ